MHTNNFRHFIVLVGLTFTLMLGMLTAPVFAQSVSQQTLSGVSGGPGPVVTAFVYNFPNEDITYTESQVSAIPSSFDYQGQHFEENQIFHSIIHFLALVMLFVFQSSNGLLRIILIDCLMN